MYQPELQKKRKQYKKRRVGKAISLLIDYRPAELLVIWYKNKKHKILQLRDSNVLSGPIPAKCFTLVPEMGLLQVGLVQYIRFAIWEAIEKKNTISPSREQQQEPPGSTIQSFAEYLKGNYFRLKGKNGPVVEFRLPDVKEEKLIAALRQDLSSFEDYELNLVPHLPRPYWSE